MKDQSNRPKRNADIGSHQQGSGQRSPGQSQQEQRGRDSSRQQGSSQRSERSERSRQQQ